MSLKGSKRGSGRPPGAGAAIVAWVVAICCGCAGETFQDGESCFKDQDCLSGFCLQQVCSPPLARLGDAGPPEEGGREAGTADQGAPLSRDANGAEDSSSALSAGDAPCDVCH